MLHLMVSIVKCYLFIGEVKRQKVAKQRQQRLRLCMHSHCIPQITDSDSVRTVRDNYNGFLHRIEILWDSWPNLVSPFIHFRTMLCPWRYLTLFRIKQHHDLLPKIFFFSIRLHEDVIITFPHTRWPDRPKQWNLKSRSCSTVRGLLSYY
jgi:hypothetical protein